MITLCLTGDVMLGRGVDQILPHPSDPALHERYVRSALDYVELAERANGPISRPVDYHYVWGRALPVLQELAPAPLIINLETSITTSDAALPKGINYRMHPANEPVLEAGRVDACVLANNHVLDWGPEGLLETLAALEGAGIPPVGAGRDLDAARAPVALEAGAGSRILLFAFGLSDSGIPPGWAAAPHRPGVSLLPDAAARSMAERAAAMAAPIVALKQPGDVVVASVHWGSNWGYAIPRRHRLIAHALVDAGVDLVHGHSSHHPRAGEVYRDRLILYGCGDFLDDYEGISGYEEFRDDLVVLYLPAVDPDSGKLMGLDMRPFRIRKMRLEDPSTREVEWLRATLDREFGRFGAAVVGSDREPMLRLRPPASDS